MNTTKQNAQNYVDKYLKWLDKNNLEIPTKRLMRLHDTTHVQMGLNISRAEEILTSFLENNIHPSFEDAAIYFEDYYELTIEQYEFVIKYLNNKRHKFVPHHKFENSEFWKNVNEILDSIIINEIANSIILD